MLKIKELLGFCGAKGCRCRTFVTITLKGKRKEGGTQSPDAGQEKTVLEAL